MSLDFRVKQPIGPMHKANALADFSSAENGVLQVAFAAVMGFHLSQTLFQHCLHWAVLGRRGTSFFYPQVLDSGHLPFKKGEGGI